MPSWTQASNATKALPETPAPVAEDISTNEANGRSAFAVSANGVLAYRGGAMSQEAHLAWRDRHGTRLTAIGKPGVYQSVRLSPDERSAQLSVGFRLNLAIMDLATGVLTSATTDGTAFNALGPWSPDSQRIIIHRAYFSKLLEFSVASGKAREIPETEGLLANDWTADGKLLLYNGRKGTQFGVLPAEGGPPRVVSETPYAKTTFRLSRDGKFVAYMSNESTGPQIVVATFPSFSEKQQVSVDGGWSPAWRKDGRELFFVGPTHLMSVDIRTEPRIEAAAPQPLFRFAARSLNASQYAAAGDGKRFLVIDRPEQGAQADTMVVVNWTAGLKE